MAKQFQLWTRVLRWIDGDSYTGILDLSCGIYQGTDAKPRRFRCALINAPEHATPTGPAATAYAEQLAPPGEYPCVSTGLDNYGRPLLDLVLPDGRMFSAAMLAAGHAVPYKPLSFSSALKANKAPPASAGGAFCAFGFSSPRWAASAATPQALG